MSPGVAAKLVELDRAGLLNVAAVRQFRAALESQIDLASWSSTLSQDLDGVLLLEEDSA